MSLAKRTRNQVCPHPPHSAVAAPDLLQPCHIGWLSGPSLSGTPYTGFEKHTAGALISWPLIYAQAIARSINIPIHTQPTSRVTRRLRKPKHLTRRIVFLLPLKQRSGAGGSVIHRGIPELTNGTPCADVRPRVMSIPSASVNRRLRSACRLVNSLTPYFKTAAKCRPA
jgi:hypothetical protein